MRKLQPFPDGVAIDLKPGAFCDMCEAYRPIANAPYAFGILQTFKTRISLQKYKMLNLASALRDRPGMCATPYFGRRDHML